MTSGPCSSWFFLRILNWFFWCNLGLWAMAFHCRAVKNSLRGTTNEKRGELTVLLFDRFNFKLFTLKFLSKSVLSWSCERPKTAQRTLFILFGNNLFPNNAIVSEVCEKMRVTYKPRAQFKHRYYFLAETPNFARIVALFEKIYDEQPILTVFSNIGEDIHCALSNTAISVRCTMWKVCRSPTLFCYLETIIDFKWQKQGSLSSFGPLRGWGMYRFVWKSPHSTRLFSHRSIPLISPNILLWHRRSYKSKWKTVQGLPLTSPTISRDY